MRYSWFRSWFRTSDCRVSGVRAVVNALLGEPLTDDKVAVLDVEVLLEHGVESGVLLSVARCLSHVHGIVAGLVDLVDLFFRVGGVRVNQRSHIAVVGGTLRRV